MSESAALAKVEPVGAIARAAELSIDDVVARVEKIQEVSRRVMQEGRHFGTIPGVKKPSLLKPGAEILCMTFQLAPKFKAKEKRSGDHLEVVTTCTLVHIPTGAELGSAEGSCSTRESKYAYRRGERKCPDCGKSGSLLKSKTEPEWFCWRKKDGCGATFALDEPEITSQNPDRIPNPDLPDTWNTVRKMAAKRALVAAVLIVTCASDLYTQDVEEQGRPDVEDESPREPAPKATGGKPQPVAD
jgi:ribosomal protein S14